MATNDFKVFAGAGGSNVVTQSAYLALAALTTGFTTGVAASNQINKVLRQSSIIASMIGQFVSDKTAQNSTDDGTTATLEANFILAIQAVTRTKIVTSNTNFFVDTSAGSDLSNGLGTGANAFKTIGACVKAIYSLYDFAGNLTVTINIATGTYSEAVLLPGKPTGLTGAVIMVGNNVTPANVVVTTSVSAAITATQGCLLNISGITVATSNTPFGFGLYATQGSLINFTLMNFNVCANAHICADGGCIIQPTDALGYFISGSSPFHINCGIGCRISIQGSATHPITLTGTPAFTNFIFAAVPGVTTIATATVFSGSATGTQYTAQFGGVILHNSVTFPTGLTAGTVGTGGTFV